MNNKKVLKRVIKRISSKLRNIFSRKLGFGFIRRKRHKLKLKFKWKRFIINIGKFVSKFQDKKRKFEIPKY